MSKNDNLGFREIASIYDVRSQSLRLYFSSENPEYETLFWENSDSDIKEKLRYQLTEINKDACLTLLAAIEAKFRVDYRTRGERRYRDSLSRKCRELYREKELKVSFEDDILEIWKEEASSHKSSFSFLKGAFKYRHWLAHGRYWVFKGGSYDFEDLYIIATSISNLPFKEI